MSKQKYRLNYEEKQTKGYLNVFFVIVVFLVAFPFFALNLRYQVGSFFRIILDYFGRVCMMGGSALFILWVLSIFANKSIKVHWLILSLVLLWVGCWCTGTTLEIWGYIIGEGTSSGKSGYY